MTPRVLEPEAQFQLLVGALRPLRESLLAHPVYAEVKSLDELAVFMEHHVFAVWDFMSLLKALQRGLTCVDVPWVPRGSPRMRRFINEIVLGEESDEISPGICTSHFELYREAMVAVGADPSGIDQFLARLGTGLAPDAALARTNVRASVRSFVARTFSIIDASSQPAIVAAFTFGREDVIPDMFRELVAALSRAVPERSGLFQRYLERHIEVDGSSHGPLSRVMLIEACGTDPSAWEQARSAAAKAIHARLALWDGVVAEIASSRKSVSVR
jgi:Protein of unknown function (DUF3050)